jgi:hypothetical protein
MEKNNYKLLNKLNNYILNLKLTFNFEIYV